MEKEGLQRVLKDLDEMKLQVGMLGTDRHQQITKYIQEKHPNSMHYYDVWHVAKGFQKKVKALAKQKDCKLVGEWEWSMVNHMYWCVLSTPCGDGDTVVAKWLSLENHIHNKHSKLYVNCTHGRLVGQVRTKKWFKRHSKAGEKISALILNSKLKKDIAKLSPIYQTSSLEAFHSVIIQIYCIFIPGNAVQVKASCTALQ